MTCNTRSCFAGMQRLLAVLRDVRLQFIAQHALAYHFNKRAMFNEEELQSDWCRSV